MAKIRLIPLGGVGEVTSNMFVYEDVRRGDILIVDCGIGFPDEEMGVEVVVPNISYLRDKTKRIKGIILTHGHEDHFGALRYLYRRLGQPKIYGTRLVVGLASAKLEENGVGRENFAIFSAGEKLKIGSFEVETFGVTHSVPDSVGLSIKSGGEFVLHLSDHKFDWTPVIGHYFDIRRLSKIVIHEKPLLLLSDCLGAIKEGYTKSEAGIEETFDNLLHQANKRQFFLTTISSSISRIQQMINACTRHGRQVALVGFSLRRNVEVAQRLGYLKIPKGLLVVEVKKASRLNPEKVAYIIAGCYGQANSSLARVAAGEHDFLELEDRAVVVFAGDPSPPGTNLNVNLVVDNLAKAGAEVHYYEIQEDLHVSGHGSAGDIQLLFALTNPEYLLPIGGDPRHMVAYEELAAAMGFERKRVFSRIAPGDVLELSDGLVRVVDKVTAGPVWVDTGGGVGKVDKQVLTDRRIIGQEGIVVVGVPVRKGRVVGRGEITGRGFVEAFKSKKLLRAAEKVVARVVLRDRGEIKSWEKTGEEIEKNLKNFFFEKTGRRPMVVAVVVRVNS